MGVLIENRSQTLDRVALIHTVTDTSIQVGIAVDTAVNVQGVTFVVEARNLQANEVYEFLIEEDDDSGFSNPNTVESARLTGPISDLTRSIANGLVNDAEGRFLNAIGVVNVKRFVRISGTATVAGTSGDVIVLTRKILTNQPVLNVVG